MPAISALFSDIHCQPSWLVSPLFAGRFDLPISPTAGGFDLPAQRVVDRRFGGTFQAFVAAHGVRFAQRERGHAVTIHIGVGFGLAGQISISALAGDQKLQSAPHIFRVVAVLVRVAGAEKRQQSQTGHGGIGFGAAP